MRKPPRYEVRLYDDELWGVWQNYDSRWVDDLDTYDGNKPWGQCCQPLLFASEFHAEAEARSRNERSGSRIVMEWDSPYPPTAAQWEVLGERIRAPGYLERGDQFNVCSSGNIMAVSVVGRNGVPVIFIGIEDGTEGPDGHAHS